MQRAADPALHLLRGAAREGQHQDALRVGTRQHQPRDPRGERHRLSRAGAGDDEQRPGDADRLTDHHPVFDSTALLGVEHGEGVGAAGGRHGHTVIASSL